MENNMNLGLGKEMQGKKALEAFAKDVALLASGVSGKSPEEIDFNEVLGYLELLKSEAERVMNGIYAKDNSIYYTSGENISFDKIDSRSK